MNDVSSFTTDRKQSKS